jgi:hypothetical protein
MNERQEILFSYALKQLNEAKIENRVWTIGGGTVLNLRYNHRESHDIDIFLQDPQFLRFLSPDLNDGVERNLQSWVEMNNFIRLQFKEGEIDFINAPQISGEKPDFRKIFGHYSYIDQPTEIIAKKIHFRSDEFKPRDIFDLAFVFEDQKKTVLNNAYIFADYLDTLDARLTYLNEAGILELLTGALIVEHAHSLRVTPVGVSSGHSAESVQ